MVDRSIKSVSKEQNKSVAQSKLTTLKQVEKKFAPRDFIRNLSSSSDSPIWSTCRIKLPMKVKDASTILHQGLDLLSFKRTGEIVLYVTLHSPDRNYQAPSDSSLRRLTIE